MDVNIVYFHTHGSHLLEHVVWSAILLEDGDMEPLVGTGQNTLHCILLGLQTCLERLPNTTPMIIRSMDRDVHQFGTLWMPNWNRDGWEHESESQLISTLMNLISVRTIQWFKPPFTDPVDKQVQALALAEWNQLLKASSSNSLNNDEAVQRCESTESFQSLDTEAHHQSNSTTDANSLLEEVSDNIPHADEMHTDKPEDNLCLHSSDALGRARLVPLDNYDNTHNLTDISRDEADEQHSLDLEVVSELDQQRYPYIDDAGFEQIRTLFKPHSESEVAFIQPQRLLGYVEGFGYAQMGSWAFILIDRPSQFALTKGQANRNSTQRRARLQGCIQLLMSLRDREHSIEFRTQDPELFSLLTLLIEDPMTVDIPGIWEEESAFVSQLSFWIEQSVTSAKLLTVRQSQQDQAIRETTHIARENLNHLNQGLQAQFEHRRRFYPIERLVE